MEAEHGRYWRGRQLRIRSDPPPPPRTALHTLRVSSSPSLTSPCLSPSAGSRCTPLPAHSNAPRGWGGCCGGFSARGWGRGGGHLYSPSWLLFGVFGDTESGEWFLAEKQLESALFPLPNWRRRVCAVGGPFRIRPPASAVKPFVLVLRGFLRGVTGKTVGALAFRGGRGALSKLIWEDLRKVVGRLSKPLLLPTLETARAIRASGFSQRAKKRSFSTGSWSQRGKGAGGPSRRAERGAGFRASWSGPLRRWDPVGILRKSSNL